MAYEKTKVPVSQSQEAIRRLIYSHKGTGVIFFSHRPKEGFEALVSLRGNPYHIKVMAKCTAPKDTDHNYNKRSHERMEELWRGEEQRVWRVLFHHLKAVFEAADADVLSIEEIIMPYVVTHDGRTLAEHILPRLAEVTADTSRMLTEAV